MKKHFVTFLSPGTFVHEETTKEIERWDSELAITMARNVKERYNAKPFAFFFTTRSRGEKDFDSKQSRQSGRYYLGGEILTVAQVKKKFPNETILHSNMECNGWDKVIVNTNSWKIVQPFEKDDKLLDVKL